MISGIGRPGRRSLKPDASVHFLIECGKTKQENPVICQRGETTSMSSQTSIIPGLALLVALGLTGCATKHHPAAVTPPAPAVLKPIVTLDASLSAKVVRVNTEGRFVVLEFPTGELPRMNQIWYVYHAGLKAAEVKIGNRQLENTIIADVLTGQAEPGDVVREQ